MFRVQSCLALCPRVCSVLFTCSILIISTGEERAGLCASRAFVCLVSLVNFCFLFLFHLMSGAGVKSLLKQSLSEPEFNGELLVEMILFLINLGK